MRTTLITTSDMDNTDVPTHSHMPPLRIYRFVGFCINPNFLTTLFDAYCYFPVHNCVQQVKKTGDNRIAFYFPS